MPTGVNIAEESNKVLTRLEQNDPKLKSLSVVNWDHSAGDSTTRYFWLHDGADNLSRLGNAIANNTHLETIEFHNSSEWTIDTRPLVEGLQRNTTIKKLYLHDGIGIRVLNEYVGNNNGSLTQIGIYGGDLRNGGVASALARAIKKCTNLNEISICMCKVDDASLEELAMGIRGLSSLQKLYLVYTDIFGINDSIEGIEGIEGAKAIAAIFQDPSCNITHLRLASALFNNDAIQIIVSSLIGNTKLDKLDLKGNRIESSACESIINLLQDPCCNLISFRLGRCEMNNESVTKVVRSLRVNTKLKELDLSGSSFERSGYESITTLLQDPSCSINKIILRNMKDFTSEYVLLLAQSLIGCSKLEHVDLSYNKIERSGCESFVRLLQSPRCNLISLDLGSCELEYELASIIVDGLRGNTKLEHLGLSGNNIGRSGCESIATLLQDLNSSIKRINLTNCKVDDECASLLAQAMIGNNKLKRLDLFENSSITESGWNAFSTILSNCSNHTLCSLGTDYSSKKYAPSNLVSLLKLNLAVDMEPLFELDTEDNEKKPKALPNVIDWFDRRGTESNQDGEVVKSINARKLSAIYQFARAVPLKFVPASYFTHPSVVSLIQLKEDRDNALKSKNSELQQRNSELEKQVVAKDTEISSMREAKEKLEREVTSMREAKEKSDDVLKAKEDEIKDLYGRLDSIVSVARQKRKFPWD